MKITEIPTPYSVPKGTGKAFISHITPTSIWLMVQVIAMPWDEYHKIPDQIEFQGEIFTKRSKGHDGVMFATGDNEWTYEQTFQQRIAEWTRTTFPEATIPNIALRALGECLELCFAAGKSINEVYDFLGAGSESCTLVEKEWAKHVEGWGLDYRTSNRDWKSHPHQVSVQSEVADIIICMTDICALMPGKDIQAITLEKLETLKKREVGPPNELGHRQTAKSTREEMREYYGYHD